MTHPIIDQLEQSFEATLRVAQAFPTDKRDFYPAPGCMTAGEQIEHIAHNFDWVIEPIAEAFCIAWNEDKPGTPMAHLAWSQRRLLGVLAQIPADGWARQVSYPDGFRMPVSRGALVMLEHDAHHRGQLVMYHRQLGTVPPQRWPKS